MKKLIAVLVSIASIGGSTALAGPPAESVADKGDVRDPFESPKPFAAGQPSRKATARSFSPAQLTGKPDTPNAGDYPTCWAAQTRDGGKEWLQLTYREPLRPLEVWVCENCAPGAVFQVTGLWEGKEHLLWRGVDPTSRIAAKGISKIPVKAKYRYQRFKVYLDCKSVSGWNEIDAVGVLDENEQLHWAVDAAATSSYARSERIAFFDPFQSPRQAFQEKLLNAQTLLEQQTAAVRQLEQQLKAQREVLDSLRNQMQALQQDYRRLQHPEKTRGSKDDADSR